MNQVRKDIETGKQLLREKGITLTVFKQRVNAMLTKPETDEDMWVWLYECYAEGFWQYKQTIEEWAQEHFHGFNKKEHSYQLKKQWAKQSNS